MSIDFTICVQGTNERYAVPNVTKDTTLYDLKNYLASLIQLNVSDLKAWTSSNLPMLYDSWTLEDYKMTNEDKPIKIWMSTEWALQPII
jgi:hypothetical protein